MFRRRSRQDIQRPSGFGLNRRIDAGITERMKLTGVASLPVALSTCAQLALGGAALAGPHDALIAKHAATHHVPEALVRRVIHIESKGNPRVVSKGNYGLMQIRLGTARAMGYRGTAEGLLDADTNMTYAVKYLASAYRAAGCNEARAISYYQRGFYKKARSKCAVPAGTQIAFDETGSGGALRMRAEPVALRELPPPPRDVLRPRVVQVQTIVRPKPQPGAMQVASAPASTAVSGNADAPPLPPAAQTVARAAEPDAPLPPAAKQDVPDMTMLPMPKPRPASAPKAVASLQQPAAPAGDANASALGAEQRPAAEQQPAAELQPASDQQVAKLDADAVPLPQPRPNVEAAPAAETKRARRSSHRQGRASRKQAEQPSLLELLKKLTTPDKSTRYRSRSAQRTR